MNKRRYQSLVSRAVRARRLETGEFESIMDEAVNALEWPEDVTKEDVVWLQFCKDVDEGSKIPLTPREQTMLANRKRKEQIAAAKAQLEYAQRLYSSLTIKRAR